MPGVGKRIDYLGITKTYGAHTALQPTDLTIEAGEFFSIIGPSGSGKTTLLGLTAGYLSPDAGQILIDGQSIEGTPPFKRNLGMVFQNYSLFPHRSVGQNIAFPLQMRRVSKSEIKEKVRASLKLVRLEGLEDRYPHALSGGQQQRVALARASIYNPSLLIMDEPLSALDKNLREEMQFEIKLLQSKLGSTVLYVTHDQSEAAAMAHRIAIMNSGHIAQIGSARDLYRCPQSRFVAAFLGQANLLAIRAMKTGPDHSTADTIVGVEVKVPTRHGPCENLSLCVRPEAVTIGHVKPKTDNILKGAVIDAVFSNGVLRHKINIGSSFVLEQCMQMRSETAAPDIGDEVFIGWDVKDSLLVEN